MLKGKRRIFIILGSITFLIFLLARCMNAADQIPDDVRGEQYAGAATCIKCHTDVASTFAHNSHGLSSSPVNNESVSKLMETDSTNFAFNAHMQVKVEKRDSGIYQVAYINGKETRAARFDVAFGSGEKAFTFAYWKDKKLFQLPLSHFSAMKTWANSPGFPSNVMYFDRAITSRCLECHSSYVKTEVKQVEALKMDEDMERGSLIYGIDCERCHGPGKQHAVFHFENPKEKTAKYITLFKSLTRKQKMDACAVCHGGNALTTIQSVFNFQPGDNLDNFYAQDFISFSGPSPDVHGNQSEMLKGSLCYQKSEMTCQSCHSSHESIKGNMAIYSQRCISCHQTQKHSENTLAKGILKTNCIDCHMPMQASKLISFKTASSEKVSPYMLRSHKIGIYPAK